MSLAKVQDMSLIHRNEYMLPVNNWKLKLKRQYQKKKKDNTIYNNPPQIKYLDINLTKRVQNMVAKNCKMLMNEIKENLKKCRDISC